MSAQVPFSEPPWLSGFPSPYYKETHKRFQKACRAFIDEHLTPYAVEWEREETAPASLHKVFAENNMLIPNLPAPLPVEWLHRVGIKDILGVPVEEWDYFHTGIYLDEMSRVGVTGPGGSMTAGHAFGIPPIIKFGSKALHEKFLPDLLPGKKRACIAITEPGAGSDVANIATTAKKTPDGKHYIVNGEKKWITNGIWCDYFTVAVRTSDKGMNGISVLLIERSHGGVSTRRMDCQGVWSSGTTYITFEDTKVVSGFFVVRSRHTIC
jgi:acyl-CoA dehydrogenase